MATSISAGKVVLEVLWEGTGSRSRVVDPRGGEPTLIAYDYHPLDLPAIEETGRRIKETLQRTARNGAVEEGLPLLEALGAELSRLVLPEETRNRLRDARAGHLLLRLDEGCIDVPWELIHDGQDFLCCKFALGRILVTRRKSAPTSRSDLRSPLSLLLVSNPTGDLEKSSEEGNYLYQLFGADPRIRIEWFNGEMESATLRGLLPDFDIFHFSGHGGSYGDDPMRYGLTLRGGSLNATVLEDFAARRVPVPRLVFNNSCCGISSGAREPELPGSSHCLAQAFLASGCHHYVGACCDLLDGAGKEFAAKFYERALEGNSIGSALQFARHEARSKPTAEGLVWAQYALYGDPEETFLGEIEKENQRSQSETLAEGSTLLTLLFAELIGADRLLENLGYGPGGSLLKRQMQLIGDVLAQFQSVRSIQRKSDRLVVAFLRPSEAVRFSLEVQRRLREHGSEDRQALPLRIGIHMGEVTVTAGEESDFEGVVADTALRLLRIAVGGQILVSRPVFDNSRAMLRGGDLRNYESLSWLDHGAYRMKGLEEPIGICEVGEKRSAPLAPPADSDLAIQYLSPDQEPVLGWRPAVGQEIPTAPGWVLEEKLGAGGFGEVWKAHHSDREETHVFKFCFRADSLRSLKRETTLFGLLKERIGGHPNIVRCFDFYFDEAPYYLEMEYVPGKDLFHWSLEAGGVERIPLETRIELVSQIADTLQAAHDSEIIHRDIKPSNILVVGNCSDPAALKVKLTDFGVGQVVSRQAFPQDALSGFTETISATERGSHSGSRLYMAPELLVGGHATVRSDIYGLGVVLYQLITGDLQKPLPPDWREEIQDPLIAEDLSRCLSGEPSRCFNGAADLARSLRSLPERREAREAYELAEKLKKRRQVRARAFELGVAFFLAISCALGYGFLREHAARLEARAAQNSAEKELYHSSIFFADKAIGELQYAQALEYLVHCPENLRGWEWGHLLYRCNRETVKWEGHTDEVGAVAYGPDGEWVASGGADGVGRVWDLESGEERFRLTGHGAGIWSLAVSPDGRWIATGSEDKTVKIWEAGSGALARTLQGHSEEISALAFAPGGETLASGGPDSTIRLWDCLSGTLRASLPVPAPEKIWSLSFSPDGNYLAAGCEDDNRRGENQFARIFDLTSEEEVRRLPHPWIVDAAEFSPDGRLLATGGQDRITRMWDWRNGNQLWSGEAHAQSVWDLAFSPDGRTVATAGLEGTIVLWDAESGAPVRTLEGHTGNVFSVSFNRDGDRLASSGADRSVRVWSVGNDHPEDLLLTGSHGEVNLSFGSSSDLLATGGFFSHMGSSALLWNPWTARLTGSIPSQRTGRTATAFSPDGGTLCLGEGDGSVAFADPRRGEVVDRLPPSPSPKQGGIWAVLYGSGGKTLLAATRKGELSLWRVGALERLTTSAAPSDKSELQAIAWSPDYSCVALSSATLDVHHPGILEIKNGWTLMTERRIAAHDTDLRAIEYSPDGRFLATGSHDRTVKLWTVGRLEEPIVLRGHQDFILSLAFSPDSSRLVTGCEDGACKVWEVGPAEARELLTLYPGIGKVVDLAFSPDGQFLAASGPDGAVRLWPTLPWARVQEFRKAEDTTLGRIELYKRAFWKKRLEK